MLTDITQFNLERDKSVLGKEWLLTYGAYFSDEENIQWFIDAITPFLPKKKLDILYAASASGLLGERLLQHLAKGSLTLVDSSEEHLREDTNPQTTKICTDLLKMNLGKQFDLILMRSALDYFPSRESQIAVLRIIHDHLKPDGLFVNQPTFFPSQAERDVMSKIYNTVKKMGQRFFQSTDLSEIYLQAGFETPQRIGNGKILNLTQVDHIERYAIDAADVKYIQSMIGEGSDHMHVTLNGYSLQFEFPIFLAKKSA